MTGVQTCALPIYDGELPPQAYISRGWMDKNWVTEQVKKAEEMAQGFAEIAKRAKEKGIEKVAFDRGGYMYHGRVKALADAAREAGLKF